LLNGSATVRDGIFRSNTATTNSGGGAIYGLSDESSFVNCIFLDNSADGIGGAIYFAGFLTVSPVLTNCSFVGNQSVSSTVTVLGPSINPIVTNCILWGNSGGTAQISRGTVSHSIVEGSGGSDVWNMPASVIDGGGNLDADPLFVDAAGGDLHVTVLSPAIDSGDIGAPDLPPFDLDGAPRVIGPAVDMGVYEFPSALDAVFSDNLGLSLLRSLRPNPSSGPIEVVFELASPSDVSLDVCDVRGRVVSTLVRGVVPSGMHRVNWAPLPTHASSVYFVRIRAGKIMESRKVLVLR
jgi:predicted outer membrane repeat protein